MRNLIASGILAAVVTMALPAAATASAPAKTAKAPFGCDARTGQVCHFQIFYQGGRGRVVVLPAGMKESIPELTIGKDSYCVGMNRRPSHKCKRKVINATYNN